MRKVCDAYVRSPRHPFPPPLEHLASSAPDIRLADVAKAFVVLQEARVTADYDLTAELTRENGLLLLEQAEYARWKLDEVRHLPETTVFLTALLLADRWTKRG